MSNFVTHYHRNDIQRVFQAFGAGLADYYVCYDGNNVNEVNLAKVVESFFTTCRIYKVELMESVAAEIVRYLNYYGVRALNGIDEFKLVYFTGMRLAAFLARDGHVLTSNVVRFSTVLMLDERLKSFTADGRGRPELKDRLVKIIKDGLLDEKLGADGMYLVYKCSANMLKDLSAHLQGDR